MAMLHPFDPKVNKPRPNADGTVSTELTRTVQFPDGSWGNVPSLWWGDGSDVKDLGAMNDDQIGEFASRYEQQAGAKFPRFADLTQAETAAKARSAAGGGENGSITATQQPKKQVNLNINGRKVTVDDSFLSLTPEQQNATVDEIAASFGGAPAGPTPLTGKVEPRGSGGVQSSNVEDQTPPPAGPSVLDKMMNATGATVNGIVNGIPILGPMAQNTTDAIGGTVAQLTGGNYGDYVNHQRQLRAGYAEKAPLASLAGNVVGAIGSYGGLAKLPGMAVGLGLEAAPGAGPISGLLGQAGKAAASNQIIGTVDNMARGEAPLQAFNDTLGSSGIAFGFPFLGAAARATTRAVDKNIIQPIATLANRGNEATSRIAGAVKQDVASGTRMTAADEGVAAKAGADVLNADRFGSAIRTLARTSANISPEADNIFKQTTEQRFLTQGGRAVNYLKTLMGGATDDLALQEALKTAARTTNKVAYDAAYAAPKAKAIWSPKISQLITATPVKQALKEADEVAANEAAIRGGKAIRNPFTFDGDGNVTGLRPLPGGGNALPNLEYWDIVQRTLRTKSEEAAAAGKRLLAGQIKDMRTELLSELDGAVPQFKKARQGAAGFFGADDAIDAGKKAWTSTKSTPEIERAVAAMSPAEKDAFSVGFTSELIDAINASKDRVNVINNVFGSQSARDRIRIALGPQRARELEAYVKVEQALDLLRQATQGNSTTAKQLIAAGVIGGAGGLLLSGGDLGKGGFGAIAMLAGRRGLQMLGKRVDEKVMKAVADVLSSPDPMKLQRAIQNASLSQAHLDALTAIMTGLQASGRGALSAGTQPPQPVAITVNGGNPALAN